jgi:dipeptidyl aminopeptidase/acylaminoacyl peptidase
LYALAPDGTELTLITSKTLISPDAIQDAIAPSGGRIAYITEELESRVYGLTLHIVRLPDLVEEASIPLILREAAGNTQTRSPEAVRAISEQKSLKWSPDGKTLAFIALMDKPSADVYVYSVETGETTRLTEDPFQEFNPQWSRDGSHVVFFVASAFGDGESLTMRGAYAAPPFANSGRVTLFTTSSKGERLAGWATPREALIYSRDQTCGGYNLRRINVENALSTNLGAACFNNIAVDSSSGNVMLTVDEDLSAACTCASQPLEAGIYFIPGALGLPRNLSTEEAVNVLWQPDARLFYITTDGGELLAYTPDQTAFAIQANIAGLVPEISPLSGVWAWATSAAGSQAGVWVGTRTSEPRQIFDRPASFPRWGVQGRRLIFTSGPSLYVADEPEFIPFPLTTLPATLLEAAWITK